ncbi:MAG: hypothetical protein AB1567_08130 [bacterium]
MPENGYFKELKERLDQIATEIYELKESQKKTDEQFKKTNDEIERLTKKTDKEIEKTDKEIEKVNKMVGNLTDGLGKFVEAIVFPSIPKLFSKQGIKIIDISTRKERHKGEDTLEIDIFAMGRENGKDVILVTEVRSNLDRRAIDEFVKDRLGKFFDFFPEYREVNVIGIVAGIRLEGGVENYAEKRGLWVLGPSGDMAQIINKKDFKPKIWRYSEVHRRRI